MIFAAFVCLVCFVVENPIILHAAKVELFTTRIPASNRLISARARYGSQLQ